MAPYSGGLLSSAAAKGSLMRSPKARPRREGMQKRLTAGTAILLVGALVLTLYVLSDKRKSVGVVESKGGLEQPGESVDAQVQAESGRRLAAGESVASRSWKKPDGEDTATRSELKSHEQNNAADLLEDQLEGGVDVMHDISAAGIGGGGGDRRRGAESASGDHSASGADSANFEAGSDVILGSGAKSANGDALDEHSGGRLRDAELANERDSEHHPRHELERRENYLEREPLTRFSQDPLHGGSTETEASDTRRVHNQQPSYTTSDREVLERPTNRISVKETSASLNSSASFTNAYPQASGFFPPFDPFPTELKVYMYDLPSKFNWGLLSRASEWGVNMSMPFHVNGPPFPSYQGGLSHQHSPEYWLTIDLLTDPAVKRPEGSVARRVADPAEADVFFVPYWASLAYNVYIPARGEYAQELQLQQELVDWLAGQEHWKRSGGRDHLLVLHHPNAMAALRSRLAAAMWVLADFARYPPEEANLAKDVIAPYAHMVPRFDDDRDEAAAWTSRQTLLFFQGSLFRKRDGIVRELLLNVLKNEPDVIVREGRTDGEGVREAAEGMRGARYCLHPAGDTPSSNRLFDAIFSHCVPVIVSDQIELPFEDALDYRGFAIFVAARNAVTPGVLAEFLRSIPRRMWARMWARLHEAAPFFEYDNPASPTGAVNRIWSEVALRLPGRRLETHRALRAVHRTNMEGLRNLEKRLQRMDPSFVKIERKAKEAPQNHREVRRRYE